jgi:divalent metal cation (Fe/Co/Zn/Cd) transporter
LRSASPDLIRVDSHLEPAEAHYRPRQAEKGTREQVQAAIREFIKEHRLGVLPHDLQVQVSGTEVVITLHCSLAAVTSIGEAHALTERLERHLRATVPGVRRVIIHAEPLGEGAHSDTRPSDATSS